MGQGALLRTNGPGPSDHLSADARLNVESFSVPPAVTPEGTIAGRPFDLSFELRTRFR